MTTIDSSYRGSIVVVDQIEAVTHKEVSRDLALTGDVAATPLAPRVAVIHSMCYIHNHCE